MAAAYLDPNLNHALCPGVKPRLSAGMERPPGMLERLLKIFHYFESSSEPCTWASNIRHGDATDVRVRTCGISFSLSFFLSFFLSAPLSISLSLSLVLCLNIFTSPSTFPSELLLLCWSFPLLTVNSWVFFPWSLLFFNHVSLWFFSCCGQSSFSLG